MIKLNISYKKQKKEKIAVFNVIYSNHIYVIIVSLFDVVKFSIF